MTGIELYHSAEAENLEARDWLPDRSTQPCEYCGTIVIRWHRSNTGEKFKGLVVWRVDAYCGEGGIERHLRLTIPRMTMPRLRSRKSRAPINETR